MLDALLLEVLVPFTALWLLAVVVGAVYSLGLRIAAWWRCEEYDSPFVW